MTSIRWPALLLILALHVALVASWTVQRQRAAARHGERAAIQWLLPLQPRPRMASPEPKQIHRPAQQKAVSPAPAPAAEQSAQAAQPAAIAAPVRPPRADDPFAELPSSDPHRKIFRISTALGDYCIYLNEEGKKSYANCPR